MKTQNWKSILALIFMPFAFYFNLINFYFALLFLIWSVLSLKNRTVFLLDQITESQSPTLFWIITILWLLLSLLSLAYSEPIVNWYYSTIA